MFILVQPPLSSLKNRQLIPLLDSCLEIGQDLGSRRGRTTAIVVIYRVHGAKIYKSFFEKRSVGERVHGSFWVTSIITWTAAARKVVGGWTAWWHNPHSPMID